MNRIMSAMMRFLLFYRGCGMPVLTVARADAVRVFAGDIATTAHPVEDFRFTIAKLPLKRPKYR